MTDHSDLIARLEAGEGEDRELDEIVICALLAPPGAYVEQSKINGKWCIYVTGGDGKTRLWDKAPPNLRRMVLAGYGPTTSRDACAALQAECLPGWLRAVHETYERTWHVMLHKLEEHGPINGEHPTSETRAHLIAILRASGVEG